MSRRAAIVEEFDDDTDLPLPSQPLPNTGSRGPLLQEIGSEDYDLDLEEEEVPSQQAGPASPPFSQSQFRNPQDSDSSGGPPRVTDITPYKAWSCIYPIYLDAKRPYRTGERRVAREKAVWWPLSKDIADASSRLGLGTLHEVSKSHPRDWENPGRVRVQWKRKDGQLVNRDIKTKKALLEAIALQIQFLKPENAPKRPYNTSGTPATSAQQTQAQQPSSSQQAKGKLPASAMKSKSPSTTNMNSLGGKGGKKGKRALPTPPSPHPALTSRVSPYSPAIVTGVLIETVKAGMNANESGAGAGAGGPGGSGMPGMGNMPMKGKRRVVRVRQ